jgi:hypothetical protein
MGRFFRGAVVGTNPRTENDNLVFTSKGIRSQVARVNDNYRRRHVSLRKHTAMPQARNRLRLRAFKNK